MSKAQGYIVRLVRNVELALQDGALRGQRAMMARIVSRLSHTEDIHGALEHLYAVRGYDRFALRLMWLLEHAAERSERLESPATEYDVENLLDDLRQLGSTEGVGRGHSGDAPSARELEAFHQSLYTFGRVLEDLRRHAFDGRTFRGLEEDALSRVLAETDTLKKTAYAAGQGDVVKFAAACTGFVTYALDNGHLHDVRVVNMLEHANLTLQTVLAASGTEEYDSLQKNIELLQNPRELLE